MKQIKKTSIRRAYALLSVMGLIFLITLLLGAAVMYSAHSHAVVNAYLRRVEARSELISMTNLSLKWLSTSLKTHSRPRAEAAESRENLTNIDLLRIFSYNNSDGGEVAVYDLEYDPLTLAEPVADPLLFPPSHSGAYMVRATVSQKELAPLTIESVYVVLPNVVPEEGFVYVLEDKPLYWRELFR